MCLNFCKDPDNILHVIDHEMTLISIYIYPQPYESEYDPKVGH